MSTESDIDLSIFKDESDTKCNANTKECKSIKKLLALLKYYSLLDIISNPLNRDIFSHFIAEVYPSFVDDYTHLVTVHGNSVNEIETSLLKCEDINQCVFTSRHQTQTKTEEKNNEKLEPKLAFYRDLMDSLHFYVFHMYHCGLRTLKNENEIEEEIEEEKDAFESQYFDKAFYRMNKRIRERESVTNSFQRFETNKNSKFTLATEDTSENDKDDTTYLDAMCHYLSEQNISETDIATFIAFIKSEQFDSDAINSDFEWSATEGNVSMHIKNKKCIQTISDFIQTMKSMSFIFILYIVSINITNEYI